MREKHNNPLKVNLKKYSRYLVFFFVFLFLISLVRNVLKIFEAKKRIREAEVKVERLAEENRILGEKLKTSQGESFTEKQLREKLGLAKEGEIVVVLPDAEILKKLAPPAEDGEEMLPDPTWLKWLKLFQ